MTEALVTGGGGQLGKALAEILPAAIILDRKQLDVSDRESVLRMVEEQRPKIIFNAAAFTRVDAAEAEPEQAMQINAGGPRNLAEAAEAVRASLVQVSTDYVFPGDKQAPYSETDETGPRSVYGKTKLEGEAAAASCSRALIVRTSWVFGDGRNFFRSILKAAGASGELTVVSDQRGLPTYAPHLAEGILALLRAGATGLWHLAGSGPSASWADLAEQAIRAAGLDARVRRITAAEYAASRTGPVAPRPANSVLDCSKAAALGVALPPWPGAVERYATQSARTK